ncbi:MAG: vanadium-dependent haloperoxidase [Thermomicrobiales bacterium]
MVTNEASVLETNKTGEQSGWSRRRVLRLGGAAALGVAAAATPLLLSAAPAASQATSAPPVEPTAGQWKTWVLTSGSQLRLPAPPDAATTRAELAELQALAAQRDNAALDLVNFWDSGSPGYRWDDLALSHTLAKGIGGGKAWRIMALLNVAIYDATIAAWDNKYHYNRKRPSEANPQLTTALPVPNSPSYPCEHSAAAGAAATVLSYLYPADAAIFEQGATEVGRSRQVAGLAYPSDVSAGFAIGRAVGEMVVARARADGSDKAWGGSVPTGPNTWKPAPNTTPGDVTTGTWQPWVLAANDQVRLPAPAAVGSPQRAQESAEVKNFVRTNATNVTAGYWEYYGGLRVHIYWHTHLSRKIAEYRLDANPPRAARAYALLSVAHYDAAIACFDTKYAHWTPRPVQLDPTLTTAFATPNHPSFPSAHATLSSANAEMLAYIFPREAGIFTGYAQESANSRLWAGIHFRSDNEGGLTQGRKVAELVIARAKEDGAN